MLRVTTTTSSRVLVRGFRRDAIGVGNNVVAAGGRCSSAALLNVVLPPKTNLVGKSSGVRGLVTSGRKRVLSKKQLRGDGAAKKTVGGSRTKRPAVPAAAGAAPTTTATETNAKGSTGGGGGGGAIWAIGGAAVLLAGGTMMYRPDLLSDVFGGKTEEPITVVAKDHDDNDAVRNPPVPKQTLEPTAPVAVEKKSDEVEAAVPPAEAAVPPAEAAVPPAEVAVPPAEAAVVPAATAEESDESVVVAVPADEPSPAKYEEKENASETTPSPSVDAETPAVVVEDQATTVSVDTAVRAARDLRSDAEKETDAALASALRLLRKDVDETYLSDLDALSTAELKVRLVRLATDMTDQARIEALKLKEMLSLQEKEIADKYLVVLQQQRLQFEDLLSKRLREQEEALNRQSSALLKEKEDSVQTVLQAAANAQAEEHKAELESTTQHLKDSLTAKYDADYSAKLATAKTEYANALTELRASVADQAATLEELRAHVKNSEIRADNSRQTHVVSAAALALSRKLETDRPFDRELAALGREVENGGVVAAALADAHAASNGVVGVPTPPQLRARFARDVYPEGRRAASVPVGDASVGAQIVGSLLRGLKGDGRGGVVAGTHDADATDDEGVLRRARDRVEEGDLDGALEQLAKLAPGGQAAFTVRDWIKDATERVVVDRCLRIVKTECALLNETMASGDNQRSP